MFCPPSPDGRLRQPHKEAGETPQAEEANQIKAVKQALRRLTDPSELRQSTGFPPASGEIGDSHAPLHVRVQLGGGQEPSWARCRMQQMQQMMGCPARFVVVRQANEATYMSRNSTLRPKAEAMVRPYPVQFRRPHQSRDVSTHDLAILHVLAQMTTTGLEETQRLHGEELGRTDPS
jgi:hypothetical protein